MVVETWVGEVAILPARGEFGKVVDEYDESVEVDMAVGIMRRIDGDFERMHVKLGRFAAFDEDWNMAFAIDMLLCFFPWRLDEDKGVGFAKDFACLVVDLTIDSVEDQRCCKVI